MILSHCDTSEKSRLENEMIASLASAFRQQHNILLQQPDWNMVTVTGKGEIHDALHVFLRDVKGMKSVPHGADIEINDNICTLVTKGKKQFESNPHPVEQTAMMKWMKRIFLI